MSYYIVFALFIIYLLMSSIEFWKLEGRHDKNLCYNKDNLVVFYLHYPIIIIVDCIKFIRYLIKH